VLALIGIGSNDHAVSNIRQALNALRERPDCRAITASSFYGNPARDRHGRPIGAAAYVNGAVLLETHLSVEALTVLLKEIETACGRTRDLAGTLVALDLDLVMIRDESTATSGPTLLRPSELAKPYFVVPAAQVAGDWLVSGQARTIAELAQVAATQELELVQL